MTFVRFVFKASFTSLHLMGCVNISRSRRFLNTVTRVETVDPSITCIHLFQVNVQSNCHLVD